MFLQNLKEDLNKLCPVELYYYCMDYKNPFLNLQEEGDISGYSSLELQYNFTHLNILKRFFSYAPKEDFIFLDLGCGVGNVLWLALKYGAKKAYGIEISHEKIRKGIEILDEPERFLGNKSEENIFQYLKLHEKIFSPISYYNFKLEQACIFLKENKNKISFKVGGIFSSNLDKELKEATMVYASLVALFSPNFVKKDIREKRINYFRNMMKKTTNAIIGIVGVELPERKLLDKIKWEPSIDVELRIYDKLGISTNL